MGLCKCAGCCELRSAIMREFRQSRYVISGSVSTVSGFSVTSNYGIMNSCTLELGFENELDKPRGTRHAELDNLSDNLSDNRHPSQLHYRGGLPGKRAHPSLAGEQARRPQRPAVRAERD